MGYRARDGSTAYWDEQENAIIISSTTGPNRIFMPRNGYRYFADNFQSLGKVGG